jgi:two-component SAPR family response regulator
MKILALDDSKPVLKLLTSAIKSARPSAEIFAFNKPSELLDFAKDNNCDVAFLDIEMWGMNGLQVAKSLKDLDPKINIIFVTAHSEYSTEAFGLHPSGYILKPATKEAVELELENLRHPFTGETDAKIYAQTFGNFEIFSCGVPLKFNRSKTKELLAFLIDRNGAAVTMNELCAILWEDNHKSESMKSHLRKLISDLNKTLEEAGAGDIIIKRHNSIAVIPHKITCDSYGFAKGDPMCVNAYRGQYMIQYSWAENTTWFMDKIFSK